MSRVTQPSEPINTINIKPAEAAKLLGVSPQFIRIGLQRGKFPWGYAVQQSKTRYTYFINRTKLCEVEGVQLNAD